MTGEDVEVIECQTVFRGYFRIDRYRLRHRKHEGGWTGEMTREIFERGHAVAVLLYDPDRDTVVLIEQFRPGALAAGWQPWLMEIVAGIIEDGETPEQVAHRESKEEAGGVITALVPVAHYLVSPGGTSESCEIMCGRVDSSEMGGLHGLAAEHEDIRVVVVPADDAISMVGDGRMVNAAGIIALQWLALNRTALRAKWGAADA